MQIDTFDLYGDHFRPQNWRSQREARRFDRRAARQVARLAGGFAAQRRWRVSGYLRSRETSQGVSAKDQKNASTRVCRFPFGRGQHRRRVCQRSFRRPGGYTSDWPDGGCWGDHPGGESGRSPPVDERSRSRNSAAPEMRRRAGKLPGYERGSSAILGQQVATLSWALNNEGHSHSSNNRGRGPRSWDIIHHCCRQGA